MTATAIRREVTPTESRKGAVPEVSLTFHSRSEDLGLKRREPIDQKTYLVSGEIRHWFGQSTEVTSPLDLGEGDSRLGSYPALGAKESLEALRAAKEAYNYGLGEWPQMSLIDRTSQVLEFARRMEEVREVVIERIVLEIGKTTADATSEFDRTVEYIRRSCEEALKLHDESQEILRIDGVEASISREPIGTTLCMGPFNYPLNETFTTMIPALLMGNTVVMKPPKAGVLLFEPMLEALRDSFPPGVVNVIYGDGAEIIGPIMESGDIDVLSFIGSAKVADIVSGAHPEPHRLKKILGLGANNPAVVLPDADLDATIPIAAKGSLSYNGQRCTALKVHLVVGEELAREYAHRLAEYVKGMELGDPREPGVQITPLAEGPWKIQYLQELIEDAVSKGARIMNEGGGTAEGNLFTPAVLYPVTPEMRVFHEEQFGPVVPVAPISSVEEAVEFIAHSKEGQQVSIFSSDDEKLYTLASKLQRLVGRVNLNDACKRGPDELPFTGKRSAAMGTLSIRAALDEFSSPTVSARPLR
ncbi:MAG: aldehyde dehydrogenase family protein [Bdellovibrionales bacterium]|nr:aldehyde dehydrogenase family protein [Bdellovibrionales bacterium]